MIKLFTHTDLDGVGCSILAQLAFGTNVDVEYCNYDEINEKVENFLDNSLDCDCHITDISISEAVAEKIDKTNKKYKLLDHHQTALFLNKYYWCSVAVEDNDGVKTSGTALYYEWLVNNNYLNKSDVLDKFVNTVRNYDTWLWTKLGDDGIICKQINDLLYLYGRKKFIEWCITEIELESFPKLCDTDKVILDIKQQEIDSYIKEKEKQLHVSELLGKSCGFVFAERFISELGNTLCKLHPELDFVAIINMSGVVSYRSTRDDIELGKDVATVFGGGGHAKAAGSTFSKEVQLKVIEELFKC